MLFDVLDNLQDDLMRTLYDDKKLQDFKQQRNQDLYAWLDDESDDNRSQGKLQGAEAYRLKDINYSVDDWMSDHSDIELDDQTVTESQKPKSFAAKQQEGMLVLEEGKFESDDAPKKLSDEDKKVE